MGTLHQFPRQAKVNSAETFRSREVAAVFDYLDEAYSGLVDAKRRDSDAAFRNATPALEAALFHVLTLTGCSEADRPLRRLLSERHTLRGA